MNLLDHKLSVEKVDNGAVLPTSRITGNDADTGYIKIRYVDQDVIANAIFEEAEKYRKDRGIENPDPVNPLGGIDDKDERETLIKTATAKRLIAGWEGISIGDDEFPYSEENALELMTNRQYSVINKKIMEFATAEVNYRERSIEEMKKKSNTLPDG